MKPIVTTLASEEQCVEHGNSKLRPREGAISMEHFVAALRVWVCCQLAPVSVKDAAAAFNAATDVIQVAVRQDPWMMLNGNHIELNGL